MSRFAVVDIETISLAVDWRHVWEVAVVTSDGEEWCRQLRDVPVGEADPKALKVNGFYDRLAPGIERVDAAAAARAVGRLTRGRLFVGAVPSFDAARLELLLRAHGECPMWSHRLRCVETLVAGRVGREVGGLRDCADELGVAYDPDELHGALADARLAAAIYREVMGS